MYLRLEAICVMAATAALVYHILRDEARSQERHERDMHFFFCADQPEEDFTFTPEEVVDDE